MSCTYVYVGDVARVVVELCRRFGDSGGGAAARLPEPARLMHMGGPARLSRVDVARALVRARGLGAGASRIHPVVRATVAMPYDSPLDIGMDSSRLERLLGLRMRAVADVMPQCLGLAPQ